MAGCRENDKHSPVMPATNPQSLISVVPTLSSTLYTPQIQGGQSKFATSTSELNLAFRSRHQQLNSLFIHFPITTPTRLTVSCPTSRLPMSQTPTPTGSMFTDMSSSTAASPMIAPLHEPKRSALVVKQQLPLGAAHRESLDRLHLSILTSTANQVIPGQTVDHSIPGASLGQKALLAKKFAKAKSVQPISDCEMLC